MHGQPGPGDPEGERQGKQVWGSLWCAGSSALPNSSSRAWLTALTLHPCATEVRYPGERQGEGPNPNKKRDSRVLFFFFFFLGKLLFWHDSRLTGKCKTNMERSLIHFVASLHGYVLWNNTAISKPGNSYCYNVCSPMPSYQLYRFLCRAMPSTERSPPAAPS